MTENELQKAVARLLDHSGLVWCHSPNEGLRTPRQGAHAKAMGLKSGFPDVAIFDGPFKSWGVDSHFNGLAIELKVGKNKPTPSQLECHERLRGCGWRVEVCYSMDEVLAVLRECYPAKFVTR
jgi:hypothetical protein